MVYQWKTGARINVSAAIAGKECERLEAEGNLSAKSLLDASRDYDAPLHKCFTWDDNKAAEAYREQEARHIINSLEIVVEDKPVRGYFNLEITSSTSNYESTEVILKTPDKREMLLSQALRELKTFETKYQTLVELAEVFKAIHKIAS